MSFNPKTILTEDGWDAVAPDCKGKDKELRKGFSSYSSLKDDDFDLRSKAIIKIAALAGSLKAANEVKGDKDAVKHLTDVISALKLKQSELAKAKAEAEKAKALTQKKAEAEAKQREQEKAHDAKHSEDEEDDDEQGDSFLKLIKALQSLKSSRVPYHFIFCKDKPYGLVVAKRDISKSAQHKKELAQMAGGSTTPPRFGQCRRDGSKLIFELEKPLPGMARILQKWIKVNTSLGFKVMVGTESADDEEGPSEDERPRVAQAEAALPPVSPALAKAPENWGQTRRDIGGSIDGLKVAIKKAFAGEGADLVAEIDGNMRKLDGILDKLDVRLAGSLEKANAAKDAAARTSELTNAKSLLADYIKYVKSEPMIAHIDSNPFGVKTNLKQTLTDSLTQMAKAIGQI